MCAGSTTKAEGEGPTQSLPYLLCSHHADGLTLEEVGDEFGNERTVDKK